MSAEAREEQELARALAESLQVVSREDLEVQRALELSRNESGCRLCPKSQKALRLYHLRRTNLPPAKLRRCRTQVRTAQAHSTTGERANSSGTKQRRRSRFPVHQFRAADESGNKQLAGFTVLQDPRALRATADVSEYVVNGFTPLPARGQPQQIAAQPDCGWLRSYTAKRPTYNKCTRK